MISKKQRIAAAIFAAIMAISLVAPAFSLLARAEDGGEEDQASSTPEADFSEEQDKIAQLGDVYDELKQQEKQIQNQINQAKTEKDKQLAVKQQIGNQIDTTTAQIDVLTERISLLEKYIAEKEEEMREKQAEIDSNYALFKKRVCAMTKVPTGSTVGLVLGAETYSQFVNRSEITARVAQYDRELIADLNAQKAELEQLKKDIEENKTEVESDKVAMDEKKQELSSKMAETQKQIQDISLLEQQFLANKAQLQKQMKQVQAEIDQIYAEIARRSTQAVYVGGTMTQPTPTLNQITSAYGWRFGGSDFHTGVDFSGPSAYGQPIVAANTGKVAFVNLSFTPGYGYGKYLIIDHGGGITTLYGHCSAINVSVGDVVTRGQQVAQVGSTGWSTGPHLHFEVRENGQHVNPMINYLSK